MVLLYHVLSLLLIVAQVGDQDVNDCITAYRNETVDALKRRMPPLATNPAFRESIHRGLPPAVVKAKIDDPEVTKQLRIIFEPLLALYGRSQAYDLIIVKNSAPLMMSDSGVVLVVTTGMIQQATSDDELLGYAAHEIGHEYFVFYSVESRHLIQTISERGKERALHRRMEEMLSLIELQCDAFAAITLARLNRNPLEFIRGIERVEQHYSQQNWNGHPFVELRRRVVEGVAPRSLLIPSHKSNALWQLKLLLAKTG